HSRLFFIEIKTKTARKLTIGKDLYGEAALYVLEGTVNIEGNPYGSKQLLIAKDANLCTFEMNENTTVYLFGGMPFDEERFIYWNFVNSDKALFEEAKVNWENQHRDAFPLVPGDEQEYVPLPGTVRT